MQNIEQARTVPIAGRGKALCMESAASPVSFAIGPDEAPELARIFDRPGPFVTVMLATDASLDNASHRAQQRWRVVRDALAGDGAPAGALDAIESRVPDAHLDGDGLFAVADADGILLARGTDEPASDSGRFGNLPYAAPSSNGTSATSPTSWSPPTGRALTSPLSLPVTRRRRQRRAPTTAATR